MTEKKKDIDVLTRVEEEALRKLEDPDTKGAAEAVLEYIKQQREVLNKS